MNKFENKFENFKKAIEKLELVISKYNNFDENIDKEILRDSMIQRFEFTYELAWKTLKEYLKNNGLIAESMPRSIFVCAYSNHIIDNEDIWLNMIKDRNIASHEYNEEYSELVTENIRKFYITEFTKLLNKFSEI